MPKVGERRVSNGYEEVYAIVNIGKGEYKAWIPTQQKPAKASIKKAKLPDGFDRANGRA